MYPTAFLPIVLDIPGNTPMIHIALYLPTAGKETEFLTELANLRISIEHLQSIYPKAAVFLRGDCNASRTKQSETAFSPTSVLILTSPGPSSSITGITTFWDRELQIQNLM